MAGAASPLRKCIEVMMEFTGCSLAEAIKMASTNQAKMFSYEDLGGLIPGKRADLILFTQDGNKIEIQKTFVKGKEVYSRADDV